MSNVTGPKYGISTYGKTMLIDEGITKWSTLRHIYFLVNVLLLVYMTVKLTRDYLKHRSKLFEKYRGKAKSPLGSLTSFYIAFTVNNLIRGSHMLDHFLRPVYYHEPNWAYNKILVVEMEVATYANILVTYIGLLALTKVMNALGNNNKGLMSSLPYMAFWIPTTSFNLVHYTVEPPRNYGPFPNFNIAGSAITAIPILILILQTYFNFESNDQIKSNNEGKERLLNEEDQEDDDAVRRSSRLQRRRSKTPVKK